MMRRLHDYPDVIQAFPRVHFLGIAGTGMSGIAEVMITLGYNVSGSDNADNAVVIDRLRALGATIYTDHLAAYVLGADCVVISTAIAPDNPELVEAHRQNIPVLPRAAMLAELMRFRNGIAVAGTHGKTTTTSLIAAILSEAELDPTFVIGGKLLAAGSNARLGTGRWLVAEADESDGSFLRLNPLVSVITNIDADHLENYDNDFAKIKAAFTEFLHRLPFYGIAVLCADDPVTAALAEEIPRHVMRYGTSKAVDVRAEQITQKENQMHFTLCLPDQSRQKITLALPGLHNVLNALAAASVGWQLGVDPQTMAVALEKFAGIGRRFNEVGSIQLPSGGAARMIDDYGHHPRELEAVFAAVRGGWPKHRLVVAFQPHRFTRTRDHLDAFAAVLSSADALVLCSVYPAGETPIPGVDSNALARAIRARGRSEPVVVDHLGELPDVLYTVLKDEDIILMMGAGNIGQIAHQMVLAQQLGAVT